MHVVIMDPLVIQVQMENMDKWVNEAHQDNLAILVLLVLKAPLALRDPKDQMGLEV